MKTAADLETVRIMKPRTDGTLAGLVIQIYINEHLGCTCWSRQA